MSRSIFDPKPVRKGEVATAGWFNRSVIAPLRALVNMTGAGGARVEISQMGVVIHAGSGTTGGGGGTFVYQIEMEEHGHTSIYDGGHSDQGVMAGAD